MLKKRFRPSLKEFQNLKSENEKLKLAVFEKNRAMENAIDGHEHMVAKQVDSEDSLNFVKKCVSLYEKAIENGRKERAIMFGISFSPIFYLAISYFTK